MNPWKDFKAKLERAHSFRVQSGKITAVYTQEWAQFCEFEVPIGRAV